LPKLVGTVSTAFARKENPLKRVSTRLKPGANERHPCPKTAAIRFDALRSFA
jgi:hypothetical protein